MIETWSTILAGSLQKIWFGVVAFLPQFVAAIVVFLLGWIVAEGVAKIVEHIIKLVRLNPALQKAGFDKVVERAGFKLDIARFLGELVKWFVVVAFLMASLEILGLTQVNEFLRGTIVGYLPKVISAVLILVLSVVIADVLKKVVVGSAKAANISSAEFLGTTTKWAIWAFAVLIALFQLEIAAVFIQTLFTGIIVSISLALGLAFGLGGRDAAASYVDKLRREISSKQ